ncbi:hypothetical protein PPERSA_07513 [Pseudocohnilembus persalinus]|uniref:Uncharacterized protein n=1 Tax=Pseudocohnilembus persalinus TaxID=266149 RepID=A0A0V0QZP2_PSEPJ|nr:hypothetical protein PPERSA_07513 [Pseudocohnilembus persalinus]|eukprot:KRX07763.1 hypothetical protein PPERSA_07513 [Pseudocohnilembus persalinus]
MKQSIISSVSNNQKYSEQTKASKSSKQAESKFENFLKEKLKQNQLKQHQQMLNQKKIQSQKNETNKYIQQTTLLSDLNIQNQISVQFLTIKNNQSQLEEQISNNIFNNINKKISTQAIKQNENFNEIIGFDENRLYLENQMQQQKEQLEKLKKQQDSNFCQSYNKNNSNMDSNNQTYNDLIKKQQNQQQIVNSEFNCQNHIKNNKNSSNSKKLDESNNSNLLISQMSLSIQNNISNNNHQNNQYSSGIFSQQTHSTKNLSQNEQNNYQNNNTNQNIQSSKTLANLEKQQTIQKIQKFNSYLYQDPQVLQEVNEDSQLETSLNHQNLNQNRNLSQNQSYIDNETQLKKAESIHQSLQPKNSQKFQNINYYNSQNPSYEHLKKVNERVDLAPYFLKSQKNKNKQGNIIRQQNSNWSVKCFGSVKSIERQQGYNVLTHVTNQNEQNSSNMQKIPENALLSFSNFNNLNRQSSQQQQLLEAKGSFQSLSQQNLMTENQQQRNQNLNQKSPKKNLRYFRNLRAKINRLKEMSDSSQNFSKTQPKFQFMQGIINSYQNNDQLQYSQKKNTQNYSLNISGSDFQQEKEKQIQILNQKNNQKNQKTDLNSLNQPKSIYQIQYEEAQKKIQKLKPNLKNKHKINMADLNQSQTNLENSQQYQNYKFNNQNLAFKNEQNRVPQIHEKITQGPNLDLDSEKPDIGNKEFQPFQKQNIKLQIKNLNQKNKNQQQNKQQEINEIDKKFQFQLKQKASQTGLPQQSLPQLKIQVKEPQNTNQEGNIDNEIQTYRYLNFCQDENHQENCFQGNSNSNCNELELFSEKSLSNKISPKKNNGNYRKQNNYYQKSKNNNVNQNQYSYNNINQQQYSKTSSNFKQNSSQIYLNKANNNNQYYKLKQRTASQTRYPSTLSQIPHENSVQQNLKKNEEFFLRPLTSENLDMPEIPAFLTFKKISEPLTSSRKNINEKYDIEFQEIDIQFFKITSLVARIIRQHFQQIKLQFENDNQENMKIIDEMLQIYEQQITFIEPKTIIDDIGGLSRLHELLKIIIKDIQTELKFFDKPIQQDQIEIFISMLQDMYGKQSTNPDENTIPVILKRYQGPQIPVIQIIEKLEYWSCLALALEQQENDLLFLDNIKKKMNRTESINPLSPKIKQKRKTLIIQNKNRLSLNNKTVVKNKINNNINKITNILNNDQISNNISQNDKQYKQIQQQQKQLNFANDNLLDDVQQTELLQLFCESVFNGVHIFSYQDIFLGKPYFYQEQVDLWTKGVAMAFDDFYQFKEKLYGQIYQNVFQQWLLLPFTEQIIQDNLDMNKSKYIPNVIEQVFEFDL